MSIFRTHFLSDGPNYISKYTDLHLHLQKLEILVCTEVDGN